MSRRKLSLYEPYPKQIEFHALGATKRERCFLAGNQLGKSTAGGAESAYHATGLYPEYWQGLRLDHPVVMWVAGNSNETTRDNPQRILMGRTGEWGTGMIPQRCIEDVKKARGLADFIDTLKIRHVTGGLSTLRFKAYEQGVDKWQGDTLDIVWFDEEPPADIYSEGLTRTNHGNRGRGGIAYITATPLMGMTEVIRKFYPTPEIPSRALTQMTIHDVKHYTPEQIELIIASYPAHEREARSKGIPALGSGRVFPVEESMLEQPIFKVPDHFAHIIGVDFGWDHPTAAVHCVVDRDSGSFYVVNAYRQKEQIVPVHAAAIKAWGPHPVAWPHDGYVHDKLSGAELAVSYASHGLQMMSEHSTHPGGGYGVEAGVQEMHEAMLTGKFKVFSHLGQWFDEFRTYHRKDGQIVKKFDDLMSATRMAWMMKRFARPTARAKIPMVVGRGYDPLHRGSRSVSVN